MVPPSLGHGWGDDDHHHSWIGVSAEGIVVQLMLLESLSMTWVGLVLGILTGVAVTLLVSRYGISMGDSAEFMAQYGMPERLYPKLTPLSIVVGPLLIFMVTMLTALIPVLRIPTLKPVEALRS